MSKENKPTIDLKVLSIAKDSVEIRLEKKTLILKISQYAIDDRAGVIIQIPASLEQPLGRWPYASLRRALAPHFVGKLLQTRTWLPGVRKNNSLQLLVTSHAETAAASF